MAGQQFIDPRYHRRRSHNRDTPSSVPRMPSPQNQSASQGAQSSINNIDDALRENDTARRQLNSGAGAGSAGEQVNKLPSDYASGVPLGPRQLADKEAITPASPETSPNTPSTGSSSKSGKESKPKGSDAKDGGAKESDSKTDAKKQSRFRKWINNHKKQAVAGGIAAVLMGGGGGFMVLPALEGGLIHQEASIFKRFWGKNDHDTSIRTKELFRWGRAAKTGNVAESRVGIVGSKVFNSALDDLDKIGISIEPGPNGSPGKFNIDTEKLKAAYPELENMDRIQQQDFLRQEFGLEGDAGYNLSNTEFNDATKAGKFSIDSRYLGLKSTRAIALKSLSLLDDGWIESAMKTRFLTKALNLPSLFHPMDRTKAMAENKVSGKISIKQERDQFEADREAAAAEEVNGLAEPAETKVKAKTTGLAADIVKATTITGIACTVYDIADQIVTINHDRVVLASEARATDVMAVDSQMENGGTSFASWQPGAIAGAQTDKDGKGISDSQAYNVASYNDPSRGGYQMTPLYRGAFSSDTTAGNIRDGINHALIGFGPALCSKVGMLFQMVGGFAAAFATDGASLSVSTVVQFAAREGLSMAVSGVAMHFLTDFILNKTTAAKLTADAFKGPIGGELLTFGARAAANTVGVAGGGISLGNTASTMFAGQVAAEQHQEFLKKNAFARIFDPGENESIAGHLAMAITPAMSGGVTTMASSVTGGILNMGHSLTNAFSFFLPKASAAATFDWGFPQYGIPDVMLNDPDLQNPYGNASIVVDLLNQNAGDQHGAYKDRAMTCFGVNISNDNDLKVWDVTPTKDVNTSSQDYTDAHCADISDTQDPGKNWRRFIMFIFDTNTANAVACYQGDNTACATVQGQAPPSDTAAQNTAPGSGNTSIPVGDTISLANQILAKPNVISFQTRQDWEYFQQIAQTGKATDCGAPTISPTLLGVLLTLSESYKIVIGVFDDGHGCDSGFHPKGEAVDLNGVNPLNGGPGGTGNRITYASNEIPILSKFYLLAGQVLAKNGGGGLGQMQCFPGGAPKVPTGVVYFDDTCNHLHMDVGYRGASHYVQ